MDENSSKQSYDSTYNNGLANGSIDKVDASNALYNGRDIFHPSNSVLADANGDGHESSRLSHDNIVPYARHQPTYNLDAQNHNINSYDMNNCKDVNTTLHVQVGYNSLVFVEKNRSHHF